MLLLAFTIGRCFGASQLADKQPLSLGAPFASTQRTLPSAPLSSRRYTTGWSVPLFAVDTGQLSATRHRRCYSSLALCSRARRRQERFRRQGRQPVRDALDIEETQTDTRRTVIHKAATNESQKKNGAVVATGR